MSEILTAVKWTDLIAQIEPNCEANFPIAKKMSVRTVISGYMADEYPGRTFKTWVNKKDQVITVYRTA